jgi:hypothetical protein
MSIKVTLSEKEILDRPNDFELGEFARNKYWQERRNLEGPPMDDEHFFLNIADDGTVKSIHHLNPDSYDKCVICGKETPYLVSTHIDMRVGYVEGCGQGCYQPQNCDRV